ncbi:MAG: YmaF family protein [Butyricicoccaceae bacterium]
MSFPDFTCDCEKKSEKKCEERREERCEERREKKCEERREERCEKRREERCEKKCEERCEERHQTHVHEVQGSTEVAGRAAHNHRFATVSDEVIRMGNDHVHEIKFRTDFAEGHYHEFCGRTGGAVWVGGGRHVHFLESITTEEKDHRHKFRVATLIEDPTDK